MHLQHAGTLGVGFILLAGVTGAILILLFSEFYKFFSSKNTTEVSNTSPRVPMHTRNLRFSYITGHKNAHAYNLSFFFNQATPFALESIRTESMEERLNQSQKVTMLAVEGNEGDPTILEPEIVEVSGFSRNKYNELRALTPTAETVEAEIMDPDEPLPSNDEKEQLPSEDDVYEELKDLFDVALEVKKSVLEGLGALKEMTEEAEAFVVGVLYCL